VKKKTIAEVTLECPIVALKVIRTGETIPVLTVLGLRLTHLVINKQYPRGLSLIRSIVISSVGRARNTFKLVYLWGEPGFGKTYEVRRRWPEAFWLTSTRNNWMGSYDGEITIVIDDFRGLHTLEWMLRLCQPYPFEAENKGGHIWVCATTVVVVSNHPPQTWYAGDINQPAWLSRMTPERGGEVLHMNEYRVSPFRTEPEPQQEQNDLEHGERNSTEHSQQSNAEFEQRKESPDTPDLLEDSEMGELNWLLENNLSQEL